MNKKIAAASCFVAAGLTLSSCELLPPKPPAKLPLPPVAREQPGETPSVPYAQLHNKPPEAAEPQIELYPGTDRSISPLPSSQRKTTPRGAGSYSLNFDDADLGEVAKVILSDILGQNYVLSPKVAGKVTLQTTQALTKEELLPTLEMLLQMNNAALIKDGSIYHIEPATDALYSADYSAAGVGRAGYQLKVIPVKNVAVEDIAAILKPLVHDKTVLNVDSARNILFASGTADEMARVMDLVNTFDVDVLKGRSFGLFPLAHVEPKQVIEELEEVFNKKAGSEDSSFFRFIEIERLNAILAITHQARYLRDIEDWVHRLDRASSVTGGGVYVYRVQNMDAEELASSLNEIFTGAASTKKEKKAKVSPGQQTSEATNKEPTKQRVQKSSASNKSTQTGDTQVSGVENVRIVADVANNSIVVVATPREYDVILPVIQQLDVMPLQVLIDATIVSVNLKNGLQYGISWYLTNGNDDVIASRAGDLVTPLTKAGVEAAAAVATGGLSAIYTSGSVKAILKAQSDLGNVNVISSPSLMVLNNQEAKINVGSEVPLQTGTSSVPISGGITGGSFAQSNTIQYKDTGVTLEVTPRVNANGMVIMDIKQIVSNAVPTTTGVTTTATIDKKEIESSVAVQDGETIVLGGLISTNNSDTRSGIPFLHELPWIGPLFGGTNRTSDKSELVVLITPRVVKSKQDSRLISDEFKRKLTGIYQEVPVYIDKTTTTIR